jgi:hypothetical protein
LLIERYDGARALNKASGPGTPLNLSARVLSYASPHPGGATETAAAGLYGNSSAALPVTSDAAGNGAPALTALPQASGHETLFGGLFSDRSEPVSPVVRDLWTNRPAPAAGAAMRAANAASLVTRPLFPSQPAAVPTEPR